MQISMALPNGEFVWFAYRLGGRRFMIRSLEFGDGIAICSARMLSSGVSMNWRYPMEFVASRQSPDQLMRARLRNVATGFAECEFDSDACEDEFMLSNASGTISQSRKRVEVLLAKHALTNLAPFQLSMLWDRFEDNADGGESVTSPQHALSAATEMQVQAGDYLSVRFGSPGTLGCLALREAKGDGVFAADLFCATPTCELELNDETLVSTHSGTVEGNFTIIVIRIGVIRGCS